MSKYSIFLYLGLAVFIFAVVLGLGIMVFYNMDDNDSEKNEFILKKKNIKIKKRQSVSERRKKLHTRIKRKSSYKPVETGVVEVDSIAQQLKGMTIPEDKIELIDQLQDMDDPAVTALVNSLLDDSDADVRLAALELLEDKTKGDIAACLDKALDDPDDAVREYAATLVDGIKDKDASEMLLAKALEDSSENVREAGFDVIVDKTNDVQEAVFAQSIHSPYQETKETTADAILDISSHSSINILFEGLKDPDPDFVEYINSKIDYLFAKEFDSYDDAVKWWNENKDNYDEELFDK